MQPKKLDHHVFKGLNNNVHHSILYIIILKRVGEHCSLSNSIFVYLYIHKSTYMNVRAVYQYLSSGPIPRLMLSWKSLNIIIKLFDGGKKFKLSNTIYIFVLFICSIMIFKKKTSSCSASS